MWAKEEGPILLFLYMKLILITAATYLDEKQMHSYYSAFMMCGVTIPCFSNWGSEMSPGEYGSVLWISKT